MADVPADTTTTSSIAVGGIITGVLDPVTAPTPPDHDWYRISLTAGQSITITLSGSGADPVEDTYLRLRSATGAIIKYNDDSGGQINVSKISFTATTSGTYYIDAGSFDSTSDDWNATLAPTKYTGTYTISVQPYTAPPVWNYDQIANQLINGWWNSQGLSAHHFNVTQGGSITVNYSQLTTAEQTLAIAALAEWSDIIGVTFTPVTSGQAQITFLDSDAGDKAYTEDSTNGDGTQTISATVHITKQWVADYGTALDSYSFQTYIHEIGHALGLGHAGDYNGTADYQSDALFANDAWSTSIMSYFSQQDNTYFANKGFTEDFALTPMGADIVAMQQMYGLSTTTRTGDTTYGFNSNAGRDVFNASIVPDNFAYTIFDSGGNDTLDYSGFWQNQTINLNAETFSNVGPGVGNVSIARGTVIENAIGGSGNDILIGNSAANVLTGNLGHDTLTGGAGGDTFRDTKAGMSGDTITDFSVGDKIVLTDASLAGFTFSISGNTLTYSGGSLTFGAALSGTLVASEAAGGGVQLAFANSQIFHHAGNDFNNDGISDVLWRNDAGAVQEWLGQANGSYAFNSALGVAQMPLTQHIVATDDFNGDGRADVLWRNDSGTLSEWVSQTNGAFVTSPSTYQMGTNWHVAQTGDYNHDGRTDIVWQSDSGGVIEWLGQVDGSFAANSAVNQQVGSGWSAAESGDFNGDGRDDILWTSTSGATMTWLGQSDGSFVKAAPTYQMPAAWQAVGSGDFNGDGLIDVLWRNGSTGGTIEWLGQPNATFSFNSAANSSLDPSWHVAQIGDFNGDARDDILWRNTSGSTTAWIGQTDGSFHASGAIYAMPTNWHVEDHLFF